MTDVEACDKSRREINHYFREADDSFKWPICGRFNATERAIRRVRKFCKDGGYNLQGMEYYLALEAEISRVVNSEV